MSMISKPRNLKGELLATEPWVEQKIADVSSGVSSVGGKGGDITISSDLSMSEAGQLGIASGIFVRQVGTGTLTLSGYTSFSFSAPLSVTGAIDATSVSADSFIVGGAGMNAAGGIPTLDLNGFLKEEQLPSLAISRILPVEADGSDKITLIKKAATDAGLSRVENGELVMIYRPEEESNSSSTSLNDDYYDSVCGEYFVLNEVTVANMQLTDVKKTYSRSSVNITVNGKVPVDGNIVVALSDLPDITAEQARVLKSVETGEDDGNPTVEIDGIELSTKKDLEDSQKFVPKCTTLSVPLTGTVPSGGDTVNVSRELDGTTYRFTFTLQIPIDESEGAVLELVRATLLDSGENTRVNVILDTANSYDEETGVATLVAEADFGDGYSATGKSFNFVLLVGKCLTVNTQG